MSQFNVSVRIDAVDGMTPTLNKISTGLGTFKQAIAGVRTSTGQLIGNEFSGALNRFNQPITQITEKVGTFRDRLSQMGGILSTQATSFGVATASVWGIYNAYDSLTKVQIRASAAALRVQTLTTTLHSLTERLRIAREKGNLTDEQMAVLQERITDTQGKLNVAQERSADIAQDVQEAWAGFVTTVGPQAVAASASLVQLGSVMKSSFKDTGGFINTLKGAFSGLIPSIGGVKSESLLLGQNIGNLGTNVGKTTGVFGKLKEGLSSMGSALTSSKALFLGMAGSIGLATVALVEFFDQLKRGAEIKELQKFNQTLAASNESRQKEIDKLKEQKNSWGQIATDFFKNFSLVKTDSGTHVIDEVIKSLESQSSRATAAKPLENLLVSITNAPMDPRVKAGVVAQINTLLAMYRNDANWSAGYGATADAVTANTKKIILAGIQKLQSELMVGGVPAGLTGALRDLYTKTFKGVEFTGQTKLFAIDAKPYAQATAETKKLAAAYNAVFHPAQQFGFVTKEAAEEMANLVAQMKPLQEQTSEQTKKFLEVQKSVALYMDTSGESLSTLETWDALIKENITSLDEEKQALDDTNRFWAELSQTMVEHIIKTNEAIGASINYTAALDEENKNRILISDGYKEGIKQAAGYFDTLVKGTEQEGVFNDALADGAKVLGIKSNLLAFSSGKMKQLIQDTYEQSKAYDAEALAVSKSTAFLKDKVLIQSQVNKGMIDGGKAANDWAIGNVKATAEGFAFHEQLLHIVADMTGLAIPIGTSDEALKKMAKTFEETQNAGLAMEEMMTDKLTPSFERMSGVIQSKDMKELRDNLKNLELPKGFNKDLDDAFKPLQGAAESARKVGNAMDILVTTGENMSKKDLAKNTKAFGNELDRLSKIKGTSKPVDEILDSLKKMSPEQLSKHTGSMQFLVDTINQFGSLPKDKAEDFLQMYNDETQKVGPNSETAAKGVDKLTSAWSSLVVAGSAVEKQLQKAESMFDPSKGVANAANTKAKGSFKVPEFLASAGSKTPTKATLDISEATANITRLIGNFNGWLAVAKTEAIAKLNPVPATQSITKVIGNFSGWFNMVSGANPPIKANPAPATQAITKAMGNFAGWFNMVSGANPPIKANPVPATQAITKVIGNFSGWFNMVKEANPAIKANNSDAMGKINAVKNALGGLADKTVTVHVKVDDPKNAFGHASGGIEYASKSTPAVFGEAGPEIAAFFPLKTPGQPRKGDYDITIPTPVLDTSGIRNALSGLGGPTITNNNTGRAGPSTVYISIPIYLAEGLAPLKTFVRKVVLDDLGMFPST